MPHRFLRLPKRFSRDILMTRPAALGTLTAALLAGTLGALPGPAGAVNLCSRAGGYSVAEAQEQIFRGDAALSGIGDCTGGNWPACQAAESFYLTAQTHLQQVLRDAMGAGCIRCDPRDGIGDLARLLAERGAFLAGAGYANDLGAAYREYQPWAGATYCQGAAPGGQAGQTGQAGPLGPLPGGQLQPMQQIGGATGSTGATGGGATTAPAQDSYTTCRPATAYTDVMLQGAITPDMDYDWLSGECLSACDADPTCKSFDMIWVFQDEGYGACVLHDRGMQEAAIDLTYSNVTHYECEGR